MFRLLDFLTGDNIASNGLKLLQTWQPLCYFFIEKNPRLFRNDVPYFNQRHGLYSSPIGKTRPSKISCKLAVWDPLKQLHAVAPSRCCWPCADRNLVCKALLVTTRALRMWINRFNQ